MPSTIIFLDSLGNLKSKKKLIEHEDTNYSKIYNSIYPKGICYPNDYFAYIHIAPRKNRSATFDIFASTKAEWENMKKSEISEFTVSPYEIIELSKIFALSQNKEFNCYLTESKKYSCVIISSQLLNNIGNSTKIVLNESLENTESEYTELYLNDRIIFDKSNSEKIELIRCAEFHEKYKMKT